MPWHVLGLLTLQFVLIATFCFFGVFNVVYGLASLRRTRVPTAPVSNRPIAVVIVSFNEEHVLESTVRACEELTYSNKLIVLADDSTDQRVVEMLRRLAIDRGAREIRHHRFFQESTTSTGEVRQDPVEIWEGGGFVYFHRPANVGFKAGSVRLVQEYLEERGIDLMYLLDADWHPQPDALERTLEVLEADDRAAFVQTKRLAFPRGMNRFQRYAAINEEGCYHVDFQGRQAMGHPILFSGCCTLLRLDRVKEVGGFRPGHLTEDLDLTDRLWLAGWKGIYLGSVVNHGEVPFSFDHFRRQQERWAAGSARCLREYGLPILASPRLGFIAKLSMLRQNAYFTTSILTILAMLLGIATIAWLVLAWNSPAVEHYLYALQRLRTPLVIVIWGCVASNFVQPLVTVLAKQGDRRNLVHLPMTVWYGWSTLYVYALGSLKGLLGIRLDWFRTPKFLRGSTESLDRLRAPARLVNLATLAILIAFYFTEGWAFGWHDYFAYLWLPAFLLAAAK